MLYDLLVTPFADFGFMRRALVASLALSVGGSAIGVFLILRRMSLMGDALAHSLLPGAALGFLLGGLSLPAMSLGGFIAGVATALGSGIIARFSSMREDASFAAAYLTAMALGVLIVSMRGSAVDLMNILFGAILAVDDVALILVMSTTTLTLIGLAAIYRPLVVECFNPGFLAAMGIRGSLYHYLLLALAVLNMMAGFQALGTLMRDGSTIAEILLVRKQKVTPRANPDATAQAILTEWKKQLGREPEIGDRALKTFHDESNEYARYE